MGSSSEMTVGVLLLFSFALGLKHAVEPDHLAAVSTIVSERKDLKSAWIIGGLWGLGHTIALMIAGVLFIGLQFRVSERLAGVLEFGVALMLIGLGVDTLRKVIRGGKVHWHVHRHGGITHVHPHVHGAEALTVHDPDSDTHHGAKLGVRPLVVGMVHGMAGSGALMLLILTTISSPVVAIAYIAIFGIGSIGGMMAMSTVISLPFHFALKHFSGLERVLTCAAGVFSLAFGIFWAVEQRSVIW